MDRTPKSVPKKEQEKRSKLDARATALKSIRSTWMSTWRDIADNVCPTRFRENRTDANQGTRKNQQAIINFTPTEAARTLASGMASGISSPSRPWFRLALSPTSAANAEQVEVAKQSPAAKKWLGDVEDAIREALAKSNLYAGFANVYADVGPFGTGVQLIEDDDEDDVRAYHFAVGSYCLAAGPRGDVDTLYREVSLTVAQVVKLFGEEACSDRVMRLYDANKLEERVEVAHFIQPNEAYRDGAYGTPGKAYSSDWWERESSGSDGFLRQSGYDECPFQAPRWQVTGEDVYGRGPGWDALGDCRALQKLERRAAQAAEKIVNPPMAAPSAASTQPITLLPGEVSFVDGLGTGQALRPAVVVPPAAVEVAEHKIRQHEDRIKRAYYAHLWLQLTNSDATMTAREVDERREEKLQQLGVVLEQLQDELLDRVIERVFSLLQRRGRIPAPPEELQGLDFKAEYISIMAQAQKALATTGITRVANFVLSMVQVVPDIVDKVNFDVTVDELAEAVGVPPRMIRTEDEVAAMRQRRAEARAQQQQALAAQEAATTAKTLSDTSTEGSNGLTELLRGMGAR